MKKCINSFIGIPLPEKFSGEFAEYSKKVKSVEPGIVTVYPHPAHITLFYLATQTEQTIHSVVERIAPHLGLLRQTSLTVSGLGYFTDHQPRVLFLKVEHPENLAHYNSLLQEQLKNIRTDSRSNRFHPHLTFGRIKTDDIREKFIQKKGQFEILCHHIQWQFEITEIVLYGVDLDQPNPHQEKLITLTIT